jgi:hypothetical protein
MHLHNAESLCLFSVQPAFPKSHGRQYPGDMSQQQHIMGPLFTVNATYSEFGSLSVETWVQGTKSLRDAAIESGNALTRHLKNLGIDVRLDIDDTDICGSESFLHSLCMFPICSNL